LSDTQQLSNASVEEMQKLQGIARITSLQPPYSLIRRNKKE
jgi:aryl-alcohol dehydrogenase-like predicted oxidoreductase